MCTEINYSFVRTSCFKCILYLFPLENICSHQIVHKLSEQTWPDKKKIYVYPGETLPKSPFNVMSLHLKWVSFGSGLSFAWQKVMVLYKWLHLNFRRWIGLGWTNKIIPNNTSLFMWIILDKCTYKKKRKSLCVVLLVMKPLNVWHLAHHGCMHLTAS